MKKYLLTIAAAVCALLSSCTPESAPEETQSIKVTPAEIQATHAEKTVEVKVEANCRWTVSKSNDNGSVADWIKVDKAAGNGSMTINVKVEANPTGEKRSGTVDFKSDKDAGAFIIVTQEANPNPDPDRPDLPEDPDPEDPDDPQPPVEGSLTLEFDFTVDPLEGWPTTTAKGERYDMLCNYPIDGTDYEFHLVEAPGINESSSGGSLYWKPDHSYFLIANPYRYLGFPLVEGYALKTAECTVGKLVTGTQSYVTSKVAPIVKDEEGKVIVDQTVPPEDTDPQSWEVDAGTVLTYEVNSSDPEQRYYLFCHKRNTAMSHLKLIYTPVE